MRALLWSSIVIACVSACGARTELGGTKGSSPGPGPCTKSPWIVFDYSNDGPYDLYAMRQDGSSFHALDLGGLHGFQPSISPDGASLLFLTSNADGTQQSLVLFDLASDKPRTIIQITVTPPSTGLGKGAVSPDNKLIAYGNTPDLHVIAFDGGGDHTVVSGPYNAGCCPWSYGHPVFSGDSSTIFFSTIGILESVHPDGSALEKLYQDQFFDNPLIPGLVFPNASMSPDFTKIVTEVACDVSQLKIFAVADLPADPCATGTKLVETHLTQAYNEATNQQWGPAGMIAYEDGADILLIDENGGTPTNLTASVTTSGQTAADPTWASGCANIP